MTLTTHAVAGGLIGAVAYQQPVLGASVAFMSHFLLDAIPHWDYKLRSSNEDASDRMNNDISIHGRDFIIDLGKIGFDFMLGLLIVYFLFLTASSTVLTGAIIGAIFAVLPDPLQFVYMKWRHEPLVSLQKFHMYMHATSHLKDKPLIGIFSQVLIILIFSWLSTLLTL